MTTLDDITILIEELRRCRADEREAQDDLTGIENTLGNMQHTWERMKTQLGDIAKERVATEIILSAAVMHMADLDGQD